MNISATPREYGLVFDTPARLASLMKLESAEGLLEKKGYGEELRKLKRSRG